MSTSAQLHSRKKVQSTIQKGTARGVPRAINTRRKALRRLPDRELLSGLERLHGDERAALLDILLSLSELERRRLYVPMGYGSLFEFCIDTYRYSRSTAWRRISAARCIERFPQVADMFLAGELNLCAVSTIAGILTRENAAEILSRVGGRPIKEVEMLVARYRPVKVIRDRMRPAFILSPAAAHCGGGCSAPGGGACGGDAVSTSGPTIMSAGPYGAVGGEYSSPSGTTPGCANAPSGGDNANQSFNIETECQDCFTSGIGNTNSSFNVETGLRAGCVTAAGNASSSFNIDTGCNADRASAPGTGGDTGGSNLSAEPERVVAEQRYKIEFAVKPEFIAKLDKIKALLSPRFPKGMDLEHTIDILMDEYLDRHCPERRMKRRKKRGENRKEERTAGSENERKSKPVARDRDTGIGNSGALKGIVKRRPVQREPVQRKRVEKRPAKRKRVQRRPVTARTRHIPQAVRDEVFVRDGGRCTFIGKNGRRCEETCNLEIDHIVPYEQGGDNSPGNLRLLCGAHNRLAAERAYGADHMKKFYRRE